MEKRKLRCPSIAEVDDMIERVKERLRKEDALLKKKGLRRPEEPGLSAKALYFTIDC